MTERWEQASFDFDSDLLSPIEDLALWTPRDIYVRLNQRVLELFKEDKRLERKNYKAPSLDGLAVYLSMYSNTVEGGVFVYGVTDDGDVVGCDFSTEQINSIERCHVTHCPMAKPDFKRVPVIVNGQQRFCIAIYIPYIGRLVETNKGEAYIRYGSSKHEMSDEEKRDYRSTRQELSFELEVSANYSYPVDFDLRVIQDLCDAFRTRELRSLWTNEEVLIDRHLLREVDGVWKPLNALVLLAARDPTMAIPGCRVRVQRFEGTTEGWGESYSPRRDRFFEGHLVRVIKEAREAIATSFVEDVTWLNAEGKFVTTPEYPEHAWLEALVNACVHRSYTFSGTEVTLKFFADRLQVESPGGFVPPVNEKTIYTMRSSRNPCLMEAMRILGYVQMAREGTRRIRESMAEYMLPEPIFKQESLHGLVVRVTLKNDQGSRKRASNADVARHFGVELWKKLEEHEVKLIAYAFRNGSIQVIEAQRTSGRTWATSKKDLDRLVSKGLLIYEPGKYVRDSRSAYRIAPPYQAAANPDVP